ncbi:hypothetical protein THAOC_28596, partial [Thalassiosira oceanica]
MVCAGRGDQRSSDIESPRPDGVRKIRRHGLTPPESGYLSPPTRVDEDGFLRYRLAVGTILASEAPSLTYSLIKLPTWLRLQQPRVLGLGNGKLPKSKVVEPAPPETDGLLVAVDMWTWVDGLRLVTVEAGIGGLVVGYPVGKVSWGIQTSTWKFKPSTWKVRVSLGLKSPRG